MVQNKPDGYIEIITGCMFAGKTEELLRRLRRAEIADQDIEVFKPDVDNRYETKKVGTHNGKSWEATVVPTDESGMETLVETGREYDIVAIDELNFFEEVAVPAIKELASDGTRVIISGTDQTFRGEAFTPVHTVMAIADEVSKLNAICECCGGTATMNQRLLDGSPAPEDSPTVYVGGSESYEARCRRCHELPAE